MQSDSTSGSKKKYDRARNGEAKKQQQVRFCKRQLEIISSVAKERGVSISDVIREAVDDYIVRLAN